MSMALQTTYSTAPAIGIDGQLGNGPNFMIPAINAEASVSMPFGRAYAFKPSAPTTDLDATVFANSTDRVMGILAHSDSYSRAWTDSDGTFGDLDSTGLRVGVVMSLLQVGMILVRCVTGCVPGDGLFVAYNTTGSTYTVAGTMGNAAESGHTIDCSKQGVWMSTATAGGLAWLKVDFGNKA